MRPAQGLQQGTTATGSVAEARTGVGDAGAAAGVGPGRTTGAAVSAGPGSVGTPLPVPACGTIGAPPGTASAGAPAATGAPAPAGTGTPPGKPAGTGTPPGRPPGAGAPSGPGRTTGAGAPAAGAATPDIGHVGPPPIGSGAAAAAGLNAKTAPHNPAPAARVMPTRSTIFNAKLPCIRVRGGFPQSKGAPELYRCPGSFPRRATQLVVEPRRIAGRAVTTSFPNDDLRDGSDTFVAWRTRAW